MIHEKRFVLDGYVRFLCGLDCNANFSAQVQSSATLKWQDNSGNEQGFAIEMLSPTDADFTEAGTVGVNITQFTLSPSSNYGDSFCFRALNVNGPPNVTIPPRLKA
jgi:hypothetical protein